jgi:hypothetical protein
MPLFSMLCVAGLLGAAVPAAGPPPPQGLACSTSAGHYLTVSWQPVADGPMAVADLYDVQCADATSSGPFVSFTSRVSPAQIGPLRQPIAADGHPQAASSGLQCRVRSHDATAPSIVSGWSVLSKPVLCAMTSGGGGINETYRSAKHALAPAGQHGGGGGGGGAERARGTVRSVVMWRVSEFQFSAEVDFLSNHNSANLAGSAALLTIIGAAPPSNASSAATNNSCTRGIETACPGLTGQDCVHCVQQHVPVIDAQGVCNGSIRAPPYSPANSAFNEDLRSACKLGAGGPAGMISMQHTPLVGYCVDMLDGPYVDYLSCNNPPAGTGGPGLPPAGDFA